MQVWGHRVKRRNEEQIVECLLLADLSVHTSVAVGACLRHVRIHLLVKLTNIAHCLAEHRLSTPKNKWIRNYLSHLSKKDIEHNDVATVTKKSFLSHAFDMLGMDF